MHRYLTGFRFGRFAVCLDAPKDCADRLRGPWRRYLADIDPETVDARLSLSCGPLPGRSASADGWSAAEEGEKRRAVYAREGQALFALEYGAAPREVNVLLPRDRKQGLRPALQFGTLLALRGAGLGLHGVTLLCGDEVLILSAPSGTGKTTLSHLLERYCDALVINGDFALLSCSGPEVLFEPTPFCGTSRRSIDQRVRVRRVVFLEQSPVNRWQTLTGGQALAHLMSNAFVPAWDDDMAREVRSLAMQCASGVRMNRFAFSPTEEAARVFLHELNR